MPAFLPFMGMLGNLGRAGLGAYRTMRGIRAARAAAGQPMGYQRLLGTSGQGLGKGTSGTGLQGLMARGTKKAPGAMGATEAGTGVLLGGEGVGDIMQGSREGDIGQIATGIGSLALGTPLLSRGVRTLGMSRRIPGSAREALQTTGKEFTARIPKGTTAVGLGGIGTGLVLGDKPAQAETEPQVLGDPVQMVLQAVEADKKNIGKKIQVGEEEIVIGSPRYKELAKQKLNEAYQQMEGGERKTTATADRIADVFTFDPAVTGGSNVTNEGAIPKTPPVTDLDEGEIQALAKKQEKDAEKGAAIKAKALRSKEADEFNNFYNRITNLTGGNDQTNNLLLFKLATGLMSGKTSQEGIRGFLDVAGQAGAGVADTALALFSREQDRRKDLAVAFLKAKEKQTPGGIVADKERRTVVVRDPSLPFGARTVQIGTDKKTGLDVMFVPTPDGSGTMAVPMKYTEYTPVKKSEARLDKMRKQLSSIEQGYKFTQVVDRLPNEIFGLSGKGRLAFEKATGAIGDVFELAGFGDIGSASSNQDAEIVELITADKLDDAGNIVPSTEKERRETQQVVDDYKKEIRGIMDGAKVSDGQIDQLTRARLIEVRMKYILANANKSEDRLTRADVQDAEQATKILGLLTGEREVKASYKNLAKDLQDQFNRISKNYIEAGGNEEFLMSFEQMPYIRMLHQQRANQQFNQGVQQNQMDIIGTIE